MNRIESVNIRTETCPVQEVFSIPDMISHIFSFLTEKETYSPLLVSHHWKAHAIATLEKRRVEAFNQIGTFYIDNFVPLQTTSEGNLLSLYLLNESLQENLIDLPTLIEHKTTILKNLQEEGYDTCLLGRVNTFFNDYARSFQYKDQELNEMNYRIIYLNKLLLKGMDSLLEETHSSVTWMRTHCSSYDQLSQIKLSDPSLPDQKQLLLDLALFAYWDGNIEIMFTRLNEFKELYLGVDRIDFPFEDVAENIEGEVFEKFIVLTFVLNQLRPNVFIKYLERSFNNPALIEDASSFVSTLRTPPQIPLQYLPEMLEFLTKKEYYTECEIFMQLLEKEHNELLEPYKNYIRMAYLENMGYPEYVLNAVSQRDHEIFLRKRGKITNKSIPLYPDETWVNKSVRRWERAQRRR